MARADKSDKVQKPASEPARERVEKRGGQTAPPNAPTPSKVKSVPNTSLVPPPAPANPAKPSPQSESRDKR
jgi:hypothetical protein